MKTTAGKEVTPVTYYFKDAAMRIETTGEGKEAAMILDLEKKQMLTLMASEKMYMVMPIDGGPPARASEAAPVKTGRTETILGYECAEYKVTGKKTVTEYWAAKGLGTFRAMRQGGPPGGPSAWEREAQKEGLFPLRIVERNAQGKVISQTEATAIKLGSLEADLFEPPAGYQKFEMPGFGKMFGG